ncbi:MAG TPA: hypothetical protein VKM55_17760 [Candidatus Lokiarchaeia archaeon]|nr:hypothetical protein [Candidatus Lokiarchaeia archaeon]
MDNLGWKPEQLLDAVKIQIRKDMQKELTLRVLNNIISGYKTPSYYVATKIFDALSDEEDMRSQSLIGPLVSDIHSEIEIIESDKTVGYAIEFMKKHGYDQVPVSNKQKTKNLGSINSVLLVQKFSTSNFLERNVADVMGDFTSRESVNE